MKRSIAFLLLPILVVIGLLGCSRTTSAPTDDRTAPLLEGMGGHSMPITTDDAMSQRYFDQGLVLAYGFNHAEAARSFREASRRDSSCAMCYWGEALALGPNINAAMSDDAVPMAYAALQNAQKYALKGTAREQAYIDALSYRYVENAPADRSFLDRAYADAMRDVAQRFPDDADAQVLFGEALMDTTPWNYWEENGQAKPVTDTILSTLESVLARLPNHPGANHFYIHAVEAEHPERGIKSAERLQDLVPGAGHLVHMPSHIFIRVGRYHEGSLANERAIAADDSYVTQCHAQGMYPIGYMPHNHHFLWATTTMEGRAQRALDAAQTLASHIDTSQMREPGFGTLQHYWVTPLYAQVRFGQWSDILDTNAPTDDLVYPTAVWHYAHAMARIRTGDLSKAEEHLTHLQRLASHPALEEVTIWDINTTADIMQVATRLVAGELAAAHGNMNEAVQHIREAVSLEDNLNYDEPPSWHHPVRQTLGAVLLQANRPVEAERAYREDLSRFPENGWSLLGLEQSLRAQGQAADAEEVRRQFDKAWQYADVNLISSRM